MRIVLVYVRLSIPFFIAQETKCMRSQLKCTYFGARRSPINFIPLAILSPSSRRAANQARLQIVHDVKVLLVITFPEVN